MGISYSMPIIDHLKTSSIGVLLLASIISTRASSLVYALFSWSNKLDKKVLAYKNDQWLSIVNFTLTEILQDPCPERCETLQEYERCLKIYFEQLKLFYTSEVINQFSKANVTFLDTCSVEWYEVDWPDREKIIDSFFQIDTTDTPEMMQTKSKFVDLLESAPNEVTIRKLSLDDLRIRESKEALYKKFLKDFWGYDDHLEEKLEVQMLWWTLFTYETPEWLEIYKICFPKITYAPKPIMPLPPRNINEESFPKIDVWHSTWNVLDLNEKFNWPNWLTKNNDSWWWNWSTKRTPWINPRPPNAGNWQLRVRDETDIYITGPDWNVRWDKHKTLWPTPSLRDDHTPHQDDNLVDFFTLDEQLWSKEKKDELLLFDDWNENECVWVYSGRIYRKLSDDIRSYEDEWWHIKFIWPPWVIENQYKLQHASEDKKVESPIKEDVWGTSVDSTLVSKDIERIQNMIAVLTYQRELQVHWFYKDWPLDWFWGDLTQKADEEYVESKEKKSSPVNSDQENNPTKEVSDSVDTLLWKINKRVRVVETSWKKLFYLWYYVWKRENKRLEEIRIIAHWNEEIIYENVFNERYIEEYKQLLQNWRKWSPKDYIERYIQKH